jgi:LysM repeat protein
MVKSFLTIAGLVLCTIGVQAQDMLQAQGTAPDLYVVHTVKKGETLYSLGRAFSLSPKDIASENSITPDKGLQLGAQVKIPLNNVNFSQKADAGPGGGFTPVYHKVEDKETLYRLSVNHNKVPVANIRQWNNMSSDGLKKDSYVIVGWLKGSSGGAVAASNTPPPASHPAGTPPPAPVNNTPAPAPVETKPVNNPAPVNNEPAPAPVNNTPAPVPAPAETKPAVAPAPAGSSFEQIYVQQTTGKNTIVEKGPGGWFKSNAGAGKYYALHNSAPRGTIIKVTNPLNGKFIYAKVLEAIPQIKQNAGLIIKLSDSAIDALGTNEAKFYTELTYEQ